MKSFAVAALALFAMVGCTNKFETIEDDELADKRYECRAATEQSPGMAITCDNVERECERRRKRGKFVC